MTWDHEHSPRFSYGRDAHPRGVFSYSPAFQSRPRDRMQSASLRSRIIGEAQGHKDAMMVGGAILGVVAVGALLMMASRR